MVWTGNQNSDTQSAATWPNFRGSGRCRIQFYTFGLLFRLRNHKVYFTRMGPEIQIAMPINSTRDLNSACDFMISSLRVQRFEPEKKLDPCEIFSLFIATLGTSWHVFLRIFTKISHDEPDCCICYVVPRSSVPHLGNHQHPKSSAAAYSERFG